MFELKPLPYAYDALEPHIDKETMMIHHDKHHNAYMTKLNTALDGHPELDGKTIEELLSDLDSIPKDIHKAVQNNGGGYYHHNIFWEMMTPEQTQPNGKLKDSIDEVFDGFENFKEKFTNEASTHFGSGWTWLVKDANGDISIISTPNQDSPISQGLTPLIGIDTWEHAYYLKYKNVRPDYVKAWWNVVNWNYAEKLFNA
ncbi:superoxide dismutase [Candidatus Peregrinibacteria bacterium]|nr:superoxide dismutase [Candidatus Peregrinibacteria bacterium]